MRSSDSTTVYTFITGNVRYAFGICRWTNWFSSAWCLPHHVELLWAGKQHRIKPLLVWRWVSVFRNLQMHSWLSWIHKKIKMIVDTILVIFFSRICQTCVLLEGDAPNPNPPEKSWYLMMQFVHTTTIHFHQAQSA